jgi:hypothetical protein
MGVGSCYSRSLEHAMDVRWLGMLLPLATAAVRKVQELGVCGRLNTRVQHAMHVVVIDQASCYHWHLQHAAIRGAQRWAAGALTTKGWSMQWI